MRRPVARGLLVAGFVLTGAVVHAAPPAGHAVVQPSAARPADPQVYTVTVPNESESPVNDVRLRVPEGIDFVLVEAPPAGWAGRLVRSGDRISEIRWTGGEIAPEGYATFRFLARNPVEEGEITWPVVQRYADGEVQRWIGPADSDEPASRTRISEDVVPEDVIAVSGESVAEATPATGAPKAAATPSSVPATKGDDAGRDGLTLGLAGGGFLLGALALGTSLRNRRGGAS